MKWVIGLVLVAALAYYVYVSTETPATAPGPTSVPHTGTSVGYNSGAPAVDPNSHAVAAAPVGTPNNPVTTPSAGVVAGSLPAGSSFRAVTAAPPNTTQTAVTSRPPLAAGHR